MIARLHFARILLVMCLGLIAQAATPVVSNIRASQRPGTHLVDVFYNVVAVGPCTVFVAVSDNGGSSYNVPVFTLTGAVGPGVIPGNDRHVVWNAGTDWSGRFSSECRVKIIADDGNAPPAPAGMAHIPGSPFQMGDNFFEGSTSELPVHTVYVRAFFMDKFEVTRELWLSIQAWSQGNGYDAFGGGAFMGAHHPVHSISWYDAVKWCNARSEMEGLTPCYYTDASQSEVYRSGNLNLSNAAVKWTANGYRLPTEAEWEKAARGGANGRRFPWGDTVTHDQANYRSDAGYAYDVSLTRGYHPIFGRGTGPVGSFPANAYGLYDMAGNLWEWVWDAYSDTWYGQPGARADDSRGPAFTSNRVLRGGLLDLNAYNLRCASRDFTPPAVFASIIGFRCVRGL
jgi:sulfatase modifying factor 1